MKKANVTKYEITDIELFENPYILPGEPETFSANIVINDSFILQLGTDKEWSIPFSREARWDSAETQDAAQASLDPDYIAAKTNAYAAIKKAR